MKDIKIKYFADDIQKLEYIGGKKSNWIDLRASEDVTLAEGEFKLIPLGIAMELPEGYEAHIVPRSSTFKTWGIIETNSMGVIDESYCGDNDEWKFPALCLEPKEVINGKRVTVIHKGDRICQFRIMEHQPEIAFHEVKILGNEDRNGFGSSGTK